MLYPQIVPTLKYFPTTDGNYVSLVVHLNQREAPSQPVSCHIKNINTIHNSSIQFSKVNQQVKPQCYKQYKNILTITVAFTAKDNLSFEDF